MLDTHCHLDLYPDPSRTALDADRAGVFTVLVTNLPSSFDAVQPHVQQYKKLRLALGLHPLCADLHTKDELQLFKVRVVKTSFIGEIGLDFSREGFATKEKQLASFKFALECLERLPKFVTVHSRRAEQSLLDLVREHYGHAIVLHWYTGNHKVLDLALEQGHYFSINPAMTMSEKGLATIARIPQDRTLTESDGPFVSIGSRPAVPADVQLVERKLAEMWKVAAADVRSIIAANFHRLLTPLRLNRDHI